VFEHWSAPAAYRSEGVGAMPAPYGPGEPAGAGRSAFRRPAAHFAPGQLVARARHDSIARFNVRHAAATQTGRWPGPTTWFRGISL
jgi:hypothetical protein